MEKSLLSRQTRVMGLIEIYTRTLELTDIETRIAALETDLANSA